jgi:CheY-like chemotaxis protein
MEKHILVIDDEPGVRDAFEMALAGQGYAVTTAASGEEGLIKAEERRPDLVFLDLNMPGIDGVETMRKLQAAQSDVLIYIVTAYYPDFMESLSQAAEDGLVFELAQKPLSIDEIRTITRGVLDYPQSY